MSYLITHPEIFPSEYLGYVDPDDYFNYNEKYISLEHLISHINSRREAMQYPPIPNLSEKIQHYLYLLEIAPRELFHKVDTRTYERSALSDIKTGAMLALSLSRQAITGDKKAGSGGWVNKNIANQRAEICYNCPNNVKDLKKSHALQRFNNKVAALFTTLRSTDYDSALGDCSVCGCPLAQKVHYSPEVIKDTTSKKVSPESFPESFMGKNKKRYSCWVRRILENKNE